MYRDDNKPGPRVVNEDAVAAPLPEETPAYGFYLLDDLACCKRHGLMILERVTLCATLPVSAGFVLVFGRYEQLCEQLFGLPLLNERLGEFRKTQSLSHFLIS